MSDPEAEWDQGSWGALETHTDAPAGTENYFDNISDEQLTDQLFDVIPALLYRLSPEDSDSRSSFELLRRAMLLSPRDAILILRAQASSLCEAEQVASFVQLACIAANALPPSRKTAKMLEPLADTLLPLIPIAFEANTFVRENEFADVVNFVFDCVGDFNDLGGLVAAYLAVLQTQESKSLVRLCNALQENNAPHISFPIDSAEAEDSLLVQRVRAVLLAREETNLMSRVLSQVPMPLAPSDPTLLALLRSANTLLQHCLTEDDFAVFPVRKELLVGSAVRLATKLGQLFKLSSSMLDNAAAVGVDLSGAFGVELSRFLRHVCKLLSSTPPALRAKIWRAVVDASLDFVLANEFNVSGSLSFLRALCDALVDDVPPAAAKLMKRALTLSLQSQKQEHQQGMLRWATAILQSNVDFAFKTDTASGSETEATVETCHKLAFRTDLSIAAFNIATILRGRSLLAPPDFDAFLTAARLFASVCTQCVQHLTRQLESVTGSSSTCQQCQHGHASVTVHGQLADEFQRSDDEETRDLQRILQLLAVSHMRCDSLLRQMS